MLNTLKKYLCLFLAAVVSFTSCKNIGDNTLDGYDYDLIPIAKDNKWGYLDHDGKWAINPQFRYAVMFSEGLATVTSVDGKIGYIDKSGKYVINPAYLEVTSFSEGKAFVVSENGFPTCIDKTGKTLFILKDAETAGSFRSGLAKVKKDGKYCFINDKGEVVTATQYERVGDFNNNLAYFITKDASDSIIGGFIDKQGKISINAQFRGVTDFSEGLAGATTDGVKKGFINEKGVYVINPIFDEITTFQEGLAAVEQGDSWGYIDKNSKMVINPQFEAAGLFNDGLAPVKSGKDGWGFINKEGKFVINPQFAAAGIFHDNMAMVMSAGKVGFINKEGKFIINPQYDNPFGTGDNLLPEYVMTRSSEVMSDFNSPRAIATKFLKNFYGMNFSAAKEVATDDTKEMLNMLQQLSPMMPDSSKQYWQNLKFEIKKVSMEDNDRATVSFLTGTDTKLQTLHMLRQNNQWLAQFTKQDQMGTDDNTTASDNDESGDTTN